MAVSGVIRAAMAFVGVRRAVLCSRLGCSANSWGAKLKRGSFSAADLVRVASALGLRLAFVDSSGVPVVVFPASAAASDPGAGSGAPLAEDHVMGEK